ncbi:hypothetical protein TUM20983_02620 [Mycobacterium antarcticum]|uniref:EspA/EspE family type VII secretion system effector n=1 Tax=Mycolicibacterium sp. TUM20983 TaxID=3023369 RepID=UPI002385508F|nr:EspA/EspE family type VII secretion system effector [Mycolicibacterium sp. TUM20983]GLP73152.1 hypothetical protein TUM20983_02620 [Mycolicibacterium sp. TUM20983]
MGLGEDFFNLVDGVRSGIEDVPSFLGNVLTGDVHGAATDGRKLIGDVGDVLNGVGDLGVSLGRVSSRYAGTVGKLADSPILSAAQLVIDGEKKLTGSGEPEDGDGYRSSATRLAECVEVLIDAEPHDDRWDGAASRAYKEANDSHRRLTSNAQVADTAIAEVLSVEADQVSRSRRTLDETSQYLYDYGLATAIVNFVPGANAAKLAADAAAAAAALATTNSTMAILAQNSLENALRIRQCVGMYNEIIEAALSDAPRDVGQDAPFIDPRDDQNDLPGRVQPGADYTSPSPEAPIEYGPPAEPLGHSQSPPS